MSPGTIHRTAPSPLGTLGELPCEVRNEIYKLLLAKKYHILQCTGFVNLELCRRDGDILLTSKAISTEATDVIYSYGIFIMATDPDRVCPLDFSAREGAAVLDSIMNIEIQCVIDDKIFKKNDDQDLAVSQYGEWFSTEIAPLRVGEFLRHSCSVQIVIEAFSEVSWESQFKIIQTVFNACKQCKGFKYVRLEANQYLCFKKDDEPRWTPSKRILEECRRLLEPILGATIHEPIRLEVNFQFTGVLEFQPPPSHATVPKVAARKDHEAAMQKIAESQWKCSEDIVEDLSELSDLSSDSDLDNESESEEEGANADDSADSSAEEDND